MANTITQIQKIPNEIEEIVLKHLQDSQKIVDKIKNQLIQTGQKAEKDDNNKNVTISKIIETAAVQYLTRVDALFNNLDNYKKIIEHQDKIQMLNQFKDKSSFKSQLKNIQSNENYKLIIKSLYAETIAFQKIVNVAIGQEAITVFILDTKGKNGEESQAFYKFNLNKETFLTFNPSLDQSGEGIKYNIDTKFFQRLQFEQNSSEDIGEILQHQQKTAFLANNDFGKEFHSALIKSDRKVSNATEKQQSILSAMIRETGLKNFFYSTYGNLRKNIPVIEKDNSYILPEYISEWAEISKFEIKGSSVYRYLSLENVRMKKRLEIKDKDGTILQTFQKGVPLLNIFNQINSEEILPSKIEYARRFFEMQGLKYNMAYVGRRGFLKEAFFGAYFGLGLEGNNKGEKNIFNSYLQQVDSAAGRLLGDYNVIKNNITYAIQIKGEGARLTLWQFIALAKNILAGASAWKTMGEPCPTNAVEYLNRQREQDISGGHRFTKEFKPIQFAEQLKKSGIQKAKTKKK